MIHHRKCSGCGVDVIGQRANPSVFVVCMCVVCLPPPPPLPINHLRTPRKVR